MPFLSKDDLDSRHHVLDEKMSHVLLAVCVLPQSLNPSTLPKVFSARPQPCWCSTSRPRAWSSHPGEEERQSIKKSFKMRAYQQSEEDTWMKIVKTTTMRVVVTKMSAASTTSLVARIQKQESIYACWPSNLLTFCYLLTILTRENPTPPRNPP